MKDFTSSPPSLPEPPSPAISATVTLSALAKSAAALPAPADWPAADVVIYDGECRFCQAQVRRLHRLDGRNRLSFLSLHSPSVAEQFPELSHEQLMAQMYVATRDGRRLGGVDAIRYLSRRLPRLWWLAPLLFVPCSGPLWRLGYRWIAKRRYQLTGRPQCDGEACRTHFR